jgi:cytidine deaminase
MQEDRQGERDELIEAALAAASRAYAPNSGFKVGAAVLGADGRVFSGANIENASYDLSICAERVAIFSAAANGELLVTRLAVAAAGGEDAPPCGACRQVLYEFAPEALVTFKDNGAFRTLGLKDLLPQAFGGGKTGD